MAPVAYPLLIVVSDGPRRVLEGGWEAILKVFVEVLASAEHMLRVIRIIDYAIWAPRLVTREVQQEIRCIFELRGFLTDSASF